MYNISYKISAAVCVFLGILIGILGVAALIKIIYSSKASAYNIFISVLLIIISFFLIAAGNELKKSGKNKSKFEKIKKDITETLAEVSTAI